MNYDKERFEKLLDAAMDGDVEAVRRLLESGVDVNARDNEGRSALWWAKAEGHFDIATLLIQHGGRA